MVSRLVLIGVAMSLSMTLMPVSSAQASIESCGTFFDSKASPQIVCAAAKRTPFASSGRRWPMTRLTYRNTTKYRVAVRRAIYRWNKVTRLKLVKASRGKRADITIRSVSTSEAWAGRAALPPGGRVLLNTLAIGEANGGVVATDVVAHELGHALGLVHTTLQCSIMYPGVGLFNRCKDRVRSGFVACGPQKFDVNSINKLYSFPRKRGPYRYQCPKSQLG